MTERLHSRDTIVEFVRYFIAVLVGFGIDFSAAMMVRRGLDISFAIAGTIGFAAGLASNLVMFELWVFRGEERRTGLRAPLGGIAAAGIALATRLLALTILDRLVPDGALEDAAIYLLAVACSFVANYMISRWVYMRP